MEDKKVVAIEMGEHTFIDKIVTYKQNYTTNKNYVGHTNEGVPVYINKKLNKGQIREIMNGEFKQLKEGKYLAKVEQVIRKHGKDASGNEDENKEIITIELNVKGEDEFYYLTYCVKGYSDIQMEIANENLNRLMSDFNVQIVEELAGKIGTLVAKENDKGYVNLALYPQKEFFDWSKILMFDCEAKFKCNVSKVFKNGNKRTFLVVADVNGNNVEEYVCYDLNNEYKAESYDWLETKLDFIDNMIDKEFLIEKDALLIVKRITKDGVVYFNKRIGFEKKPPRKPQAW